METIVKITQKGSNSVKVSRPASSPEAPPPPPQPASSAKSATLDSVELSALASSSAGVTAGDAPFNTEQVERIKQAMRDGEFTVNASVVAEKLLEIERALVRQS
jgi:negative regulator of flagellin synthesis FlgM